MKKTTDLKKEFKNIENIGRTYCTIYLFLSNIAFSWVFYIFLIALLVIFMLKKQTSWTQETIRLLSFLLCCRGINQLGGTIQPSSVFFIISVFCLVGMLYCFVTQSLASPRLKLAKNFLGLFLGSMVLPLLLKGYLSYKGL